MSLCEIHRHSATAPWTYADLERRQSEIRARVLAGQPGRLVFSEVAPVVTLGFRRTEEDLLVTRDELAKGGVAVLEATRGGRATYHGPGQWVVFPVESLERLTGDRRGVRKVVEGILSATRAVVRDRFPRSEIRDGKEAGVWTEPGPAGAKIAALGIRIVDGVVQHGVSVNGFATPESFAGIRPCGLESRVGFCIPDGAGDPAVEFVRLRERLEAAFLARFPAFDR